MLGHSRDVSRETRQGFLLCRGAWRRRSGRLPLSLRLAAAVEGDPGVESSSPSSSPWLAAECACSCRTREEKRRADEDGLAPVFLR